MHTLWIDKSKLVPTSNVYIYTCKENDVLKDVLKYYSVLVKFLIISNYIGTMTFGPYYIRAAHTTTLPEPTRRSRTFKLIMKFISEHFQ